MGKYIVTSAYRDREEGYIDPSYEVVGTKARCREFVNHYVNRAAYVQDRFEDTDGNEVTELVLANGSELVLKIQMFKD